MLVLIPVPEVVLGTGQLGQLLQALHGRGGVVVKSQQFHSGDDSLPSLKLRKQTRGDTQTGSVTEQGGKMHPASQAPHIWLDR